MHFFFFFICFIHVLLFCIIYWRTLDFEYQVRLFEGRSKNQIKIQKQIIKKKKNIETPKQYIISLLHKSNIAHISLL